ncbi:MAG: hypothetical protein Q9220_001713 [cf. Caloplaca sp. 1 TL-2023]
MGKYDALRRTGLWDLAHIISAPNHSSVDVPQNVAFLSAIRNAKQSIFIQTPNLNAEPLLPALLDAVRRGVNVTYFGELLPFQGGTNEIIAHKLYASPAEKQNLNVYNYVGKDQIQPIHNKFKKRSCHSESKPSFSQFAFAPPPFFSTITAGHIQKLSLASPPLSPFLPSTFFLTSRPIEVKLLIADSHLMIQGSGNQDTQSWYHSQEGNVMIDSPNLCALVMEGLRRNQNTHLYGAVGKEDGMWRDKEENMAEGSLGFEGEVTGKWSWLTGVKGAVNRVRGEGGF